MNVKILSLDKEIRVIPQATRESNDVRKNREDFSRQFTNNHLTCMQSNMKQKQT